MTGPTADERIHPLRFTLDRTEAGYRVLVEGAVAESVVVASLDEILDWLRAKLSDADPPRTAERDLLPGREPARRRPPGDEPGTPIGDAGMPPAADEGQPARDELAE